MDRTQQTLNDLTNTNFRSNQQAISDLRELLNFGNMELDAAFRDTLRAESNAVEPLNYITKSESSIDLSAIGSIADESRSTISEHSTRKPVKTARHQFFHLFGG